MNEILFAAAEAGSNGLTFANVLAGLGAIGFGSIVTTLIARWFNRDKSKAETREVLTRTNLSISEIVENKIQVLKRDYEEALERISSLEAQIEEMRLQLDSDKQYMQIKALKTDVRFYKARVEILEAQNLSLLENLRQMREALGEG